MSQPTSRVRNRTVTNPTNPFSDPATNKSLPALPHYTTASNPGPAPLPASPQVGGHGQAQRPRNSLVRNNTPSVKDLARVFEKESSSSDLGSKNPFRDAESPTPPVPPVPEILQPRVYSENNERRIASGIPNVNQQHERAVSGSSMDAGDRVTSMCSVATSAGPGPDIGCGGQYSSDDIAEERVTTVCSVATSAGPGSDVAFGYNTQEDLGNGTAGYDYHGGYEPHETAAPLEFLSDSDDTPRSADPTEISVHDSFSPTLQRRQGHEPASNHRTAPTEDYGRWLPARPSNITLVSPDEARGRSGLPRSRTTNPFLCEEPEVHLTGQVRSPTASTRATYGGESESENPKFSRADKYVAAAYEGQKRVPTSFSELLIEEHRKRGGTASSSTSKQNPPPVAPPPPARNPDRKPLFKTPIPVRARSVGMNLQENPVAGSSQVNVADVPGYEPAKKAEFRLELERAKMTNLSIRNAYIQPSPTVLRLAAQIARNNGETVHSGGRAVLRDIPFWVVVAILQCSVLSTTACVAVIIRDQSSSTQRVAIGKGTTFWLVISIVLFAFSGVVVLFIWARKKGYFSTFNEKLGVDEVGLLDRVLRDSTRASGVESLGMNGRDIDVEANVGVYSRRPRTFETSPNYPSMISLETNPGWQPVYADARYRANSGAHLQTPIRPRAHTSSESLVNNASPSGIQEESPIAPPTPAYVKHAVGFPFDSPRSIQRGTPDAAHHFNNNSAPGRIRSGTRDGNGLGTGHVLQAAGWSPLENLQREINDPAVHRAPAHQRHSIIAVKRAASEEQTRSLRQSMDRGPSTRLKRVQTFESASESQGHQTIVEDEDEQIGQTPLRYPRRLNLQLEIESMKKGGNVGMLTRSPDMSNIAGGYARQPKFAQQPKFDSSFDESGTPMDELDHQTGKASSSTFVSSRNGYSNASEDGQVKQGRGEASSKAKGVFDAVRDHFTEPYGQSLRSVMHDKKGKKKEEQ
ncbi:uncharacterized protein LY89DRAFT_444535 [Mollisia scopiformis]|uniref:Uncharacterized protein n=1 Tax=Mollisia scopiformis TaxID=149040 RepID=A0A194XK22_MOLSC|nr:uncharacterized protein LY89DRAFT_444535 [Mollisia scopiformis]KUJ20486.1 hypothetical protein LY89DRAFT_444535 [Mollisia scopiformis]